MTYATTIPTLKTKRLNLRPPASSDLPAYQAFYAASDTTVGKYRARSSASEIQIILDGDINHWSKGYGMWLITLTGDDKVIGGAGLAHPDDWPRHELTWWLMPDQRGQGYATEASRAVINYGYDTLGWPQVETHMRDENLPARNLAERLGGKFLHRGHFPDGVDRDIFVLPRVTAGATL